MRASTNVLVGVSIKLLQTYDYLVFVALRRAVAHVVENLISDLGVRVTN